MSRKGSEQGNPVPLGEAVGRSASTERMVDGVPVRTYRGASLTELAPQIRAELGDSAMILRQREGVTGGIAGFFARRMIEVDVAVINLPGQAGGAGGRIDVSDGPSVGPGAADVFPSAVSLPAPTSEPAWTSEPAQTNEPGELAGVQTPTQPTVPFSAIAEQHGFGAGGRPAGLAAYGQAAVPFVPEPTAPSPASGPSYGAPFVPEPLAQPGGQAPSDAPQSTPAWQLTPPRPPDLPQTAPEPPRRPVAPSGEVGETDFDAGRAGAAAAPVTQGGTLFEDRLRAAGLTGAEGTSARSVDPITALAPLHGALVRRGLPDQIASPVVDDTLLHRVPLQPDRPVADLLASELARRIPTAPIVGRAGQAIAFVGSSGAGKTRAIARLAAAYGAAHQVPVACVTLHGSGRDSLLAEALAPFGIAVHAAPDAPRALDRITALRRTALVLVDTPGVSPGDAESLAHLGTTLELLELDHVALCLPVVLAAPIARRVLRAMDPLGPTMLVATHADEADLLGGVVAVAIDRRVPLAYVSAGAGRGGIVGADAHRIATELVSADGRGAISLQPRAPRAGQAGVARVASALGGSAPGGRLDPASVDASISGATTTGTSPGGLGDARFADAQDDVAHAGTDEGPSGPTVDVAAGPGHLAAPWVLPSLRGVRRKR